MISFILEADSEVQHLLSFERMKKAQLSLSLKAGNEIRTRDIHVGNVREASSSALLPKDLRVMSVPRCRSR